MLDEFHLPILEVEGNHISSRVEVPFAIQLDDHRHSLLFHLQIGLLDHLEENLCVVPFPLVDEIVPNRIFEQLEGKGCPVETQERWSSSDFLGENVDFVHDVFLFVALDEPDSPSSWESRFGFVHQGLSRHKHSAAFSSSQVLVGTQEGKVDLIVDAQVQVVMTAESSAVHCENDLFFCFFSGGLDGFIERNEVGHLRSHIRGGRNRYDDGVSRTVLELFLDELELQGSVIVVRKQVDILVELDPRQDVGVVLVRGDVDLGRLPLLLFFQVLQNSNGLFDGSSTSAASWEHNILRRRSAEALEETVVGVVHHFGRIL